MNFVFLASVYPENFISWRAGTAPSKPTNLVKRFFMSFLKGVQDQPNYSSHGFWDFWKWPKTFIWAKIYLNLFIFILQIEGVGTIVITLVFQAFNWGRKFWIWTIVCSAKCDWVLGNWTKSNNLCTTAKELYCEVLIVSMIPINSIMHQIMNPKSPI